MPIAPVSRTAGHTAIGYFDRLNGNKLADYLEIDVQLASITGSGVASATGGSLSVGESADTNPSNAVTIVANKTGLKLEQQQSYKIDLRSKKRYIFVTFTAGSAGASNETQVVSVSGSLGNVEDKPTAAAGMVSRNTNSAVTIVN